MRLARDLGLQPPLGGIRQDQRMDRCGIMLRMVAPKCELRAGGIAAVRSDGMAALMMVFGEIKKILALQHLFRRSECLFHPNLPAR
ncbi:hypothetical protein ROBYS_10990 [Roseobacter sp. OBYS 0001]|nr:hypothetical protein ROBYS_10990 [Roseobacter sp. OBYS 0001]